MTTTATHKLPSILPHDAEAEALIIGIILAGATTWPCIPLAQVRGQLRTSDFYNPVMQDVYEAMCSVDNAAEPVKPVKVIERMLIDGTIGKLRHFFRDGDPQDHPGLRYLEELALLGAVGGARARVDSLSDAVARLEAKREERDRLRESTDKAEAYQRNRERFQRQHAPRILAATVGALFDDEIFELLRSPDTQKVRSMTQLATVLTGQLFDDLEGGAQPAEEE